MNIFILEDDRQRIDTFLELLKDHVLTMCDTVDEAKKLYETHGPFDIVFLDHDLGGEVYVPSSKDNTGYQLAKWLSKRTEEKAPLMVIHSFNPIGAENMKSVLPKAILAPFGTAAFMGIIESRTQTNAP